MFINLNFLVTFLSSAAVAASVEGGWVVAIYLTISIALVQQIVNIK
jgi:hypothetical protein